MPPCPSFDAERRARIGACTKTTLERQAMSTMTWSPSRLPSTTELGRVLAITAATFAGAGGVIHLAQIPAHLEVRVVATGFALMGVAQCAFALLAMIRSSTRLLLIGGWFHAGIAAVWLLSRTTGLAFVPGAEEPQPVAVADVVANAFSFGVVGLALAAYARRTGNTASVLPRRLARLLLTIIFAAVVGVTVPAALADHGHHSHGTNPHPAATDPVDHHDPAPHDGPAHTHSAP